jgi:hypothetical protein
MTLLISYSFPKPKPKALRFEGGFFGNQFAFIVQFSFAYVGAMAYVQFPCRAVLAQSHGLSDVMGSPLCTALLRVSAFGIWHNATFLLFFKFI